MQVLSENYATMSDDDDGAWQSQIEELSDLHEHPFDINTANHETLALLPFLTQQEIDAIIDYRARYGALRSVSELRLIGALNSISIRWLRLFIYVVPPDATDLKSSARRKQQEVMTRLDIPLYERAGWPWAQGIGHRIRYTGQWDPHWDIGLRAEKDAGEPMFDSRNPLWDSWGGHVMLKDWRAIRTLLVGDFKATFGEGLVMNSNFRLGKQLTGLWQAGATLRPHRSAEESRYLRGVATTVGISRNTTITALYSYRRLDATIQDDNTVQSINTTGLHRTQSELAHKGTLGNHTTALHADWKHRHIHLGATASYLYYDHVFRQSKALYRQIYPEGYQFAVFGVDYGAHTSHLYISGETAHSRNEHGGAWATLNKATWRIDGNTQVALLQRHYDKYYVAPHAMAYGENSRVQNESGLALFVDADRLGPLSMNAFFDYFYNPWPRFTMSRASHGCEGSIQIGCTPMRHDRFTIRYHVKSKEKSDIRHLSHRLQTSYSHQWTTHWTTKAMLFYHLYSEPSAHRRSNGYALVPRIDYTSGQNDTWRCALLLALFDTHDYDSRLYFFEPSLSQTFSMSMLDGKGERLTATIRYQPTTQQSHHQPRRWQLQLKVGLTHYRDRTTISSGPTQISSSLRPDIQFLFSYRFRTFSLSH